MKPTWIAQQSRRPTGWIGEVVARVMSLETRAANAFARAQLSPEPGHSILEIGCGHGRSLAELARHAEFVAGIDPSAVMLRGARRRLRRAIGRGRAELHLGEAAKLPFEDARFDAALAVHVLYFWPDPAVELREIRRVLEPGGVLVLGFRPDDPAARAELPDSVYGLRSQPEVEKLLCEAGFEELSATQTTLGAMPFLCLRARAAGG